MTHRILIDDDDNATLSGLADLLRDAGFDVTTAASFEDGRRALTNAEHDLLIVDVRLGAFNGLHLVFRAFFQHPSMATIVMTAYADPVLEAEAKRYNAVWVAKPIDPPAFVPLVRRVLSRRGERDARQWPRRQLAQALPAEIGSAPASVVDVSYGGLRFRIRNGAHRGIPPSFGIRMSGIGIQIMAEPVWTTEERLSDTIWCGARIAEDDEAVLAEWRQAVDRMEATAL
jgi:CheY-like chemotaxis protein